METTLAAEAAAALRRISRNEAFKDHVLGTPGLHDLLLKAVSRFIGGETLRECLQIGRGLQKLGFGLAVDYMGESTRNKNAAKDTAEEFLKVVDAFRPEMGSTFLSPDLSHLGILIDAESAYQNLVRLAKAAGETGGEIIINMEGSDRTDDILEMHKRVCGVAENVGITLQAYLYRTPRDLEEALQRPGRIRLVKGAYEEPEGLAQRWGPATDGAFRSLMEELIANGHPCSIATQDPVLLDHAVTFIKQKHAASEPIEFEMNYGISQDRLERLRDQGYGTRIYLPYGKEWYLYLCHRFAEFPENIFQGVADMAKGN